MAVTVYWVEYAIGESPGTTQHNLGTGAAFDVGEAHTVVSSSNLNFGNTGARADIPFTPSAFPIAAGSNSYSKYFRLQWSGSYTQISNVKLWKSAGAYVTDEYVWFSGNVGFVDPATTAILAGEPDVEWTDFGTGRRIPTSQPANNNVVLHTDATAAAGTTAAVLPEAFESNSTPGYYSGSQSAVIVFQLTTSANTPAGPVNQKTFSLTYDRQ